MAVRLAMGAGRARLVRQLLVESLLLSTIGGLVGLLFALRAKDVFLLLVPPTSQPASLAFEMNARTVGFAFLVTLATAVAFGLAPALRASNPDLVSTLKDEVRGMSAARSRLRIQPHGLPRVLDDNSRQPLAEDALQAEAVHTAEAARV